MFNELDLENCPEKFAFNCKRYEVECHNCKANNTGKYLKYIPIDKSIQNHPAGIKQKKKGVASYSRKGRTNENKIINDKDYLTRTYASGMVGGDGDAKLNLLHMNSVSVEIKTRYTEKGGKGPTKAEVVEGLSQKAQVWIIQHKVKRCTYYYLTFKLFVDIQRAIFMSPNIHCISIPTVNDYMSYKYTMAPKYQKGVIFYEHYVRSSMSRGMYDKRFDDEYNLKINLIRNPLGQFVMLTEGVFDEVVYLYNTAVSN